MRIYLESVWKENRGLDYNKDNSYNHDKLTGPWYTGNMSPWHGEVRGSIPLGSTISLIYLFLMKRVLKFLKKPWFILAVVFFMAINIILTARFMDESWKVEEYCSTNAVVNHKDYSKGWKYWGQKIPLEEYTEQEKRLIKSKDGYITRLFREILNCENERNTQIKYFVFF